MRLIVRAGAVLCMAAGLLVAPATGHAVPAAAASVSPWVGADCATGHLDGLDGGSETILVGAATRCGEAGTEADFAVVLFQPNRLAWPYRPWVRQFASTGQPRPFGVPMPPRTGAWGACLMASSTLRLACARLTPVDTNRWTYEPIPLDDPLVDKPVGATIYEGSLGPRPNCGSCF